MGQRVEVHGFTGFSRFADERFSSRSSRMTVRLKPDTTYVTALERFSCGFGGQGSRPLPFAAVGVSTTKKAPQYELSYN